MFDLRRIIWLASYPKSGNTWVRSLLAHYFMPPGQAPDINNLRRFTTADVRQDFYDLAAGRPFIGSSIEDWLKVRPEALRLIAKSKQGKHFVKTHCSPIIVQNTHIILPEVTAGAIYVLRNPFDVVPSFARHTSASIDDAIERMCNTETFMGTDTGIYDILGRWDDHITRWTSAPGLPIHVVRYEDLLGKPAQAMQDLLKFLSIKPESPKIARAVKATRFETMKKQEEKDGFHERPAHMESFFTRGKAGGWRDDLTPAQVGRIRDEFAPVLQKYYPELLKETESYAASG
ncbi:MAG: sulfotransferase domain-containing protein [Pseudomonadota bacterium]